MARWKSKSEKQKWKSEKWNEISMCPPRASVGFTMDIFSTFLFSWIEDIEVIEVVEVTDSTVYMQRFLKH